MPRNLVVLEGRKNFSFQCKPFPTGAKIIGDAFRYGNRLEFVFLSNETNILDKYKNFYDLKVDDDGTRTVYYTETTDKYEDNYYHDCVVETANRVAYRAAFVVLCKYLYFKPQLFTKLTTLFSQLSLWQGKDHFS